MAGPAGAPAERRPATANDRVRGGGRGNRKADVEAGSDHWDLQSGLSLWWLCARLKLKLGKLSCAGRGNPGGGPDNTVGWCVVWRAKGWGQILGRHAAWAG